MLSFRGVHLVERFKLMWLDNLDLRYWERQQFNWHKKCGQILSRPKRPTENPLISEGGFGWFGFGHYNALRLIMHNNSELYLYQTISGKFPTYMIHHDPKISLRYQEFRVYTWILIFPFTQQKKTSNLGTFFGVFSGLTWSWRAFELKIRVKCTYLYHYKASFFSSVSREILSFQKYCNYIYI